MNRRGFFRLARMVPVVAVLPTATILSLLKDKRETILFPRTGEIFLLEPNKSPLTILLKNCKKSGNIRHVFDDKFVRFEEKVYPRT